MPIQPYPTGIAGFDDVLGGGLTPGGLYLIEGTPGSGKTTLALQFVQEGVRLGQSVLYLTLSESERELRQSATSHGWSLDGVTIRELIPTEGGLPDEQYTVFHPSEVELGATTKSIISSVAELNPSRVVIDSMSELRLLSGSSIRYRRQIMTLKQIFLKAGITVLLLDDLVTGERDMQVESLVSGVIHMEQLPLEYGTERRRIRISKQRGREFRGGYHDYRIVRGGLQVFPRLVASEHRQSVLMETVSTGLPQLDALLGGGIERGTSTLILGAAGTGKSTLALYVALTAAERGESTAMFVFDEGSNTLFARAAALGLDLSKQVEEGRMFIQQVDPAELSPGEFAHAIRQAVEERHASVVVIDSLNGYLHAMPGEKMLVIQLHELLAYLAQHAVISLLVGVHHGLIGKEMDSPVDASYLADSVILLRYFETHAEVRQAISVLKKRAGGHERTIRDFRIENDGVKIGEPLKRLRGVMTGLPQEDPS